MSEAKAPPRGAAPPSLEPWALGAVVVLYLFSRIWKLMLLPVFLDEAIHLEWAFRTAATGRLVGITDGGRYLPIWIYAVIAGGAADPLRAARLCSVASGLASVLGLAWLGRLLHSARAGVLAAFLYVAAPFTLVYDRMALVDALLAALVVYALVFVVLWSRTTGRRWAVALGLTVGAAGLTKLSGLLLLPLPALVVLWSRSAGRGRLAAQLAWTYTTALVLLVPLVLDVAGTGRFFEENLWALQSGPGGSSFITRNGRLAVEWLVAYFTPVGAAVVGLALLWAVLARSRADLLLASVAAGWCLFFVLAGGRYWFPRYVLPAVPPLLLLVGRAAARAGRGAPWAVAALLTATWLRFDAALIADPARAPLPPVERSQYVYDWPSGYGVAEAAGVLREAAVRHPIVLLRDQSSGSLKEGLDLALRRGGAPLEIVDAPVKSGDLTDAIERLMAGGRPVILAVDETTDGQLVLSLDGRRVLGPLVAFPKPDARRQLAFYAIAGEEGMGKPAVMATAARPDGDFGWDLVRQGRWTEAEGAFRASLSRDAPLAAAYNGLGVSLWMQGRRDEAVRSLSEALRLDPDELRAGFNLNVARNAMRHGR
jgi:tetratricopeptide (TPR) repeat protein